MRDLHIGDSGSDVKTIQANLNRLGERIAADGEYGPLTGAAVLSVKEKRHWPERPLTTGATRSFQAYAGLWARQTLVVKPQPKPKAKPVDKAAALRAAIVRGYQSLMGVAQGSPVQLEIEKFAGESANAAWCASGFWYVLKKLCGYNGPQPDNVAWVPAWELFAKEHNILRSRLHTLPGMAVTYVWSGPHGIGRGDHIGVVVKAGTFTTTFLVSDEANAGTPGKVTQKTRLWFQVNCVFDPAALQQ